MNPLRKLIQKTGLDIHRFRPTPDKLSFLKTLNVGTVLDIGGNVGQFAKEVREVLPKTQIYSFEPLKECFDELVHSMKEDRLFKAFNYALGDTEGSLNMNKSSYTPSSSLLPMSSTHKELFPHTKDHTNETIYVKTLDSVASSLNLKPQILIKVDVQGFESKVIAGGIKTFSMAKVVLIEVSHATLYEGQPTFDDLYQKLKNLGFKYKGSLQQKIDKKTGEIISEDSIFIR